MKEKPKKVFFFENFSFIAVIQLTIWFTLKQLKKILHSNLLYMYLQQFHLFKDQNAEQLSILREFSYRKSITYKTKDKNKTN